MKDEAKRGASGEQSPLVDGYLRMAADAEAEAEATEWCEALVLDAFADAEDDGSENRDDRSRP
ncbi:MAG TPA: hypothetical protein VG225_11130 [Terracidiphilus sp.]|jgi:hypothetical protein|nr:hypothetical protein [Terracidiphilus sp.]